MNIHFIFSSLAGSIGALIHTYEIMLALLHKCECNGAQHTFGVGNCYIARTRIKALVDRKGKHKLTTA